MSDRITHEHLIEICKWLPEDYAPYGELERWPEDDPDAVGADCSCGCVWYAPLEGPLSSDWGVCTHPMSHRCGLLTFEHQGCRHFEMDPFEMDPEEERRAEELARRYPNGWNPSMGPLDDDL